MVKNRTVVTAVFLTGILCTANGCNSVKPVSETLETIPVTATTGVTTTMPDEAETIQTTITTQVIAEQVTSAYTCTTAEPDVMLVDTLLSEMTLEEKVCQMFIVTPEMLTGYTGSVTEMGTLSQKSFDQYPVGGLIYFAENLEDPPQTLEMLSAMQSYAQESSGVGVFLSVDEEGGTVARVADQLGTTKLHDMAYYGDHSDPDEAYAIGCTIGSDLRQFGFNLDFAPVADVALHADNELGDRIFSSDADIVGDMVAGVVSGLQGTGVSATLKHFPGLGAGDGNTHYDDFVLIDRSLSELSSEEFVPFQAGIDAGADFIMVGHQVTVAAGDQLPSDLSYTVVTTWLKEKLEFTGIIITDAQNMESITENYSPASAAVQAVSAGVDMILMPLDLSNAVNGICEAVESGTITEERINESVRKILTQKSEMGLLKYKEEETETTTT